MRILYLLVAVACLGSAGCSSVVPKEGFFVKSDRLDWEQLNHFEYLGGVIVVKEGFSLLGFIPFSSASEETGKQLLIQRALKNFPMSDGLMEVRHQVIPASFGDWTPTVVYVGKVVKKR